MRVVQVVRVVMLFALVGLGSGCRHPQEGSAESAIDVGGRERTFLYRLPPGHTASAPKKWPMVLMLHGQMGNGQNMEKLSHASDLADRHGFVVIYPDGVDRSWNDYRGATKASEQGIDDVAFVRALVDRFVTDEGVDPNRVYIAGMSNGGMMSFRIACELSDRFAAFAVVGGLMPSNGADTCRPSRPVSAMVVAGVDDPIVPFGGGTIASGLGDVLSADATRARWEAIDGCAPADVSRTIDDTDDGTRVHEVRHTRCREGTEVAVYSVEGGGHAWPSGDGAFPELLVGKTSTDMDATEEALRFFERHPRPRAIAAPETR